MRQLLAFVEGDWFRGSREMSVDFLVDALDPEHVDSLTIGAATKKALKRLLLGGKQKLASNKSVIPRSLPWGYERRSDDDSMGASGGGVTSTTMGTPKVRHL